MFVLQRTADGAYVADPSSNPTGGSYTRKLEYARTYATREQAEGDRCPENERVIDAFHLFVHRRRP